MAQARCCARPSVAAPRRERGHATTLPGRSREGCVRTAVALHGPGRPIRTPHSGIAGVWTDAETSAVTMMAGACFIMTVPVPVAWSGMATAPANGEPRLPALFAPWGGVLPAFAGGHIIAAF